MKRIGFIHEKIVSVENCREAIINASKHKRKRKNVQKVLADIDFYANDLSERLLKLDFTTPYRPQTIIDGPSGKKRDIMIPSFYPDQCAHHAIMQVLQPIIIRSSYYWSCGNFPRRGLSRAAKGVRKATLNGKNAKYCFKFDIKKFYPSIPHDKLKEKLGMKIKDKKALEILYCIIDSHPEGLPIGNYTSPWLAEFYLQDLDRRITACDGVRYYVRYVDDGVLIGPNKRKLHRAGTAISDFLTTLGLRMKENYQLFQIWKNKKGRKIDFIGECFAIGFSSVRKRRALAFMRQSRRIQKAYRRGSEVSFKEASGFLSRSTCLLHTKSFGLRKKYYYPAKPEKLKEIVRRQSKCITQVDTVGISALRC